MVIFLKTNPQIVFAHHDFNIFIVDFSIYFVLFLSFLVILLPIFFRTMPNPCEYINILGENKLIFFCKKNVKKNIVRIEPYWLISVK
jgi:hypothetical protein